MAKTHPDNSAIPSQLRGRRHLLIGSTAAGLTATAAAIASPLSANTPGQSQKIIVPANQGSVDTSNSVGLSRTVGAWAGLGVFTPKAGSFASFCDQCVTNAVWQINIGTIANKKVAIPLAIRLSIADP